MPNGVTEEVQLGQDGSNLANVLGTLPRKRQAQIAKRLCELVPLYADVDVRPAPNTGYHRVVFQDRWKDFWYDPHHVSDGTMILLAFLTLAYMQRPPGACVAVAVAR
jgi:predicted ATPase